MRRDKNDKYVCLLIVQLFLIISLLIWFEARITQLITSSITILVGFLIIYLYKSHFLYECKRITLLPLLVCWLVDMTVTEVFVRQEWTDLTFVDEIFVFRPSDISKSKYKGDEGDEYHKSHKSHKNNLKDKENTNTSSTALLSTTAGLSIFAFLFSVPLIFNIIFRRFLYEYVKQRISLRTSYSTGQYIDTLMIIGYIIVNSVIYSTIITILNGTNCLTESVTEFIIYFLRGAMLCLVCDLNAGILASIILNVLMNGYLLVRSTVGYFYM